MDEKGEINDHVEFILSYNSDQTVVSLTVNSVLRLTQTEFLNALAYFMERTEEEGQNLFAEEPQEH